MAALTSDSFLLASNVTGTTTGTAVAILGGVYAVLVVGTVGTSTLEVMDLAGNWISVWTLTATSVSSYETLDLPPGQVRVVAGSGASALYVTLARVPAGS